MRHASTLALSLLASLAVAIAWPGSTTEIRWLALAVFLAVLVIWGLARRKARSDDAPTIRTPSVVRSQPASEAEFIQIRVFDRTAVVLTGAGAFVLAIALLPVHAVSFGAVWAVLSAGLAWSMRTARVTLQGTPEQRALTQKVAPWVNRGLVWGALTAGMLIASRLPLPA